jgi:AcrR family transcriptional regulator
MNNEKMPTKGERRRAEIVQISRDILVEEGYEAFILREIAKRAGMKLGNLQYYFPNRESLLAAVITTEGERDREILASMIEAETTPEAQLSCFCETIIKRWSGSSGRIFTTMMFLSQNNSVFDAIYKDLYDHFYSALTPILIRLDPDQKKSTYRQRAMLVTALIDGAPIQVAGKDTKDFIKLVAAEALRIGGGQS